MVGRLFDAYIAMFTQLAPGGPMSLKTYAVAGLVVLAVTTGLLWYRGRIHAAEALGAAHARIERDSALVEAIRDSLKIADAALGQSMIATSDAFERYDSIRKARPRVIRLPGEVVTRVDTVPPALDPIPVNREWLDKFVAEADGLRQECELLRTNCANRTRLADSSAAAWQRIAEQRAIAQVISQCSFGTKAISFGAGAVVGAVISEFRPRK